MSNLYCDLAAFKDRLSLTGTGDDAALLPLLEYTSRAIDDFCNRFFYVKTETRYYDGSASPLVLDLDLISVTSLKTDNDESSASWETTWASTDYELLPYNSFPKYAVAVTPWGVKSSFNKGQKKSVEIAGSWGYRQETEDSGADVNETFSATDTTLTVTDGAKLNVGQTVLVDSEQLYVSAIAGNDLTVQRGLNGSTGAAHASGADISVFTFPGPIVVELPGAAEGRVFPRLDPDVERLLAPFRRVQVTAV